MLLRDEYPGRIFGSADSGGVTEANSGSEDCKGVAGGRFQVIAGKTRRKSGSADSTGVMSARSSLCSGYTEEGSTELTRCQMIS